MLHPDLPTLPQIAQFLKETKYELKQHTFGGPNCGCAVSAIEIMLAKKYPDKITPQYGDRIFLPNLIGHTKTDQIIRGFDGRVFDPSDKENEEYYDYGRSIQSLLPQTEYNPP